MTWSGTKIVALFIPVVVVLNLMTNMVSMNMNIYTRTETLTLNRSLEETHLNEEIFERRQQLAWKGQRSVSHSFLELVGVRDKDDCKVGEMNVSCPHLARMIELASGSDSDSLGSIRPYNLHDQDFKIFVFGGSITSGSMTPKTYSELLQDQLKILFGTHIKVYNFGVGASGPETPQIWMCCGDAHLVADLFISEYAVNVGTDAGAASAMALWYDSINFTETIVLDLWSWLRGGPKSKPIERRPTILGIDAVKHRISVVDFVAGCEPFWQNESPFFASDLYPHVSQECGVLFDNHTDLPPNCPSALQHGGGLYHHLVALSISYKLFLSDKLYVDQELKGIKLYSANSTDGSCLSSNGRNSCYGHWGLGDVATENLRLRNVLNSIEMLSSKPIPDSWTFGSYDNNLSKMSYFTNSTLHPISFLIPPLTSRIKIQFVGKSQLSESVSAVIVIGSILHPFSSLIHWPTNSSVRISVWKSIEIPRSSEFVVMNISAKQFYCSFMNCAALEITGMMFDSIV
jgi:hypothetical protein